MAYDHQYRKTNDFGNTFRTGTILIVLFIVLEIFYGLTSNSMALLSDAGHNLSDVIALVFPWVALGLSRLKPTINFT